MIWRKVLEEAGKGSGFVSRTALGLIFSVGLKIVMRNLELRIKILKRGM